MKRLIFILMTMVVMMTPAIAEAQNQITRPTKKDEHGRANPNNRNLAKHKIPNMQVRLSTPDGYVNGFGYVDLGLPSGLKWADCNLGASSPVEDGDRFARGEIAPKKSFTAVTQ